jgi:hypothetical protein
MNYNLIVVTTIVALVIMGVLGTIYEDSCTCEEYPKIINIEGNTLVVKDSIGKYNIYQKIEIK